MPNLELSSFLRSHPLDGDFPSFVSSSFSILIRSLIYLDPLPRFLDITPKFVLIPTLPAGFEFLPLFFEERSWLILFTVSVSTTFLASTISFRLLLRMLPLFLGSLARAPLSCWSTVNFGVPRQFIALFLIYGHSNVSPAF